MIPFLSFSCVMRSRGGSGRHGKGWGCYALLRLMYEYNQYMFVVDLARPKIDSTPTKSEFHHELARLK